MLTTARYPADEVTRERARLVERLTIARSRAGVVAAESRARRMYGEHPYARELPQVADVSTVTRNQVVGLHAELVRPAGAVLVIVGDVSPARTLWTWWRIHSRAGTERAERSGCPPCHPSRMVRSSLLIGRARCNPPCGWAVSRFDVMPTDIRLCNWRISFSVATSPRGGTRTSVRTRGIPTARTAGSNTMCSARRWCSTRMSRPR